MSPVADIQANPKGLEARWILNAGSAYAVTLNDKSQYECYFVEEIGGLDDAEVRAQVEPNPSRHGATPLTGYYGSRNITFTGYIRALNLRRLREMQSALKTAIMDLGQEWPLQLDAGGAYNAQIWVRKSASFQGTERQEGQNYWRRPFQITLQATDPRFLSLTEHSANTLATGATILGRDVGRDYPLSYVTYIDPGGHAVAPAASMNSVNAGNFESYPRFVFHGPLPNPMLTSLNTGEQMALLVSILNGETITVDTATRTIIDQAGVNRFRVWRRGNHWLRLVGGFNGITLTTTSIDVGSVDVYWRDAWL